MSEQDKKQKLLAIGDMIRKARMTTWVNRILGARVPIIAFETIRELGEISVDISIRNDEDSGPRAIPVVKQYLQEMPALRTLIHAVKAFLSFRDLNDASQSTLSSYAITIMCISFLQVSNSSICILVGRKQVTTLHSGTQHDVLSHISMIRLRKRHWELF